MSEPYPRKQFLQSPEVAWSADSSTFLHSSRRGDSLRAYEYFSTSLYTPPPPFFPHIIAQVEVKKTKKKNLDIQSGSEPSLYLLRELSEQKERLDFSDINTL